LISLLAACTFLSLPVWRLCSFISMLYCPPAPPAGAHSQQERGGGFKRSAAQHSVSGEEGQGGEQQNLASDVSLGARGGGVWGCGVVFGGGEVGGGHVQDMGQLCCWLCWDASWLGVGDQPACSTQLGFIKIRCYCCC
jgi:hypothetical protein